MKILVVDDAECIRTLIIHMLREMGHTENDEATNGVQALKLMHKKQYGLLITDLNMPYLDGKQLLEKIRKEEKFANLPVLMVSAEEDGAKIKAVIQAKVNGFLMKPICYNNLSKQLSRLGI